MEVPTGSCQVCGTGRRLKKDGTLPRHKSVYGDVCPGAAAIAPRSLSSAGGDCGGPCAW